MSDLVIGIGASHTTLMNTQWAKVDHLQRAHDYRDGLLQARELLKAARPDVAIVIGSNHFRGFWLDLMPAFTIGVGDVISSGEHGTPAGPLPTDPVFAHALCQSLVEADVDMAFSDRLTVDHGISHAVQWVMGEEMALPIVPIVINCFAPPLPSLSRSVQVGRLIGDIVARIGEDKRVAIIATGGLSHQLPFPDWRSPASDDDRFLAQSWKDGRNDWEQFEKRRRDIIVNAPPRTNPDFDKAFLARLEEGTLTSLATEIDQDDLVAAAGNGGNEIRAWLMMAAAMNDLPGKTIAHADMPEWLTGMAVASIEPDPN
ncbi:catechol 1,2-dioxygenase [Croceicoccus sediminis]|uniref:DODA-type extradiol aromatic ring-opening family dioxygenase n=1 Tax=Croceicoccus sediminis TaxID=2571150 RepID=UPI001182C5A1|nr:catechol 1,2-dioxygenase [Croceicoccus sediminis]